MSSVTAWLEALGLGRYAEIFSQSEIDLEVLPDLTEQDLKDLGIPLGHCKKLMRGIRELQQEAAPPAREPAPARPAPALAAHPASGAERRQLTVMFCDLAGSTALSTRMDPEDLRNVIRAFQKACEEEIRRFDGLIARYMGDGILAYFGYPQAHEDDAQRALHAGLGVVEVTTNLRLPGVPALSCRVGIATGVVVVGELIGEGDAREREVLGETPNLAARLQSLAASNCVVISETTRRLAGESFEFEDLGEHVLKGFHTPAHVWRLLGRGITRTRFEALHGASLIPMIGREREAAMLRDCWQRAERDEGRAVVIAGEPGIGKSRLVEALYADIQARPHLRMSFQCFPYHVSSALYPFRVQLESAAGFEEEDCDAVRLDRLAELTRRLGVTDEDAVPLLAELVCVPAQGRYPALVLTPQQRKERTFEVLLAMLAASAAARPVLLVFEDVHWLDPTSTQLLTLMLARTGGLRMLALLTIRSGSAPPWPESARVAHLTLERIGREESAAIAARLTDGKPLPGKVLDQILAHTDGVPLFVEEVTRHVLASGVLAERGGRYTLAGSIETLAIPATLQDLLVARLDRLGPNKSFAQIGAALGRRFTHDLFAAVAEQPEPVLETALEHLVACELMQRHSLPPPPSYSFSHALVRDAAYSTLVRAERRRLHARAARALEHRFADVAVSTPELVAYHFTEAGEDAQAVIWWHKAGEVAARRSANLEAIAHLERGLELLAGLPETPQRDQREIEMQTALGQAYFAVKGFAAGEVERAYSRAQQLCSRPGAEPRQIMRVTTGLWNFHMVRGNLSTALELAQQRFQLAMETGDALALPGAHQNRGAILFHFGQFEPARQDMEEGIALYDGHTGEGAVAGSFDPRMGCLCYQSWALWMLGRPAKAVAAGEEMMAIAERLAHPVSLAFALFYRSSLDQLLGEAEAVEERARRLVELSAKHQFEYRRSQGAILLGWALAAAGRGGEGMTMLREGLDAWAASGAQVVGPYFHGLLADACLRAGEAAESSAALDTAFEIARKTGEHAYDSMLHALRGEVVRVSRHRGAGEQTGTGSASPEEHFGRAVEVAQAQEAGALELRAATALVRCLDGRGAQARSARAALAAVIERFTEGFETADLRQARLVLAGRAGGQISLDLS